MPPLRNAVSSTAKLGQGTRLRGTKRCRARTRPREGATGSHDGQEASWPFAPMVWSKGSGPELSLLIWTRAARACSILCSLAATPAARPGSSAFPQGLGSPLRKSYMYLNACVPSSLDEVIRSTRKLVRIDVTVAYVRAYARSRLLPTNWRGRSAGYRIFGSLSKRCCRRVEKSTETSAEIICMLWLANRCQRKARASCSKPRQQDHKGGMVGPLEPVHPTSPKARDASQRSRGHLA